MYIYIYKYIFIYIYIYFYICLWANIHILVDTNLYTDIYFKCLEVAGGHR